MAGEWSTAPLGDLVEEILDRRGVTPLKLRSEFVPSGYRVISAKLIKDGRIDSSANEARFVDGPTYKKWMLTPLLPDDVILTSEAPLGEAAYIDEPREWCLGQRLFGIRTRKSRLFGRFLYYALHSEAVRHDLHSRATGTTAQGIRQSELRRVLIPLPPLPEQRAIAHILGTLDDKIDLNRRMSETLEAIARVIFKSWFVDFDPVRAKAEGRESGLPPHIADLFPDRFEESDLGEIPAGWEVKRISDVANCVKGTSYRSADLQPSATSLVTLKSFHRGGGYREDGLKPYVGEYKGEEVVNPGEVVVACTDVTQAAEVVGRPAIVRTSGFETLVASLDVLIVRPREGPVSIPYLYGLLQDEAFTAYAYAHTTGTTVLHLAKDAVPSYQFALPSWPILQTFGSLATALFHRIDRLQGNTRTLAALRDALLPKLISGELRVPAAERSLKEHAL